jgi:leucyl aminopeptidase
MNQGVNMAPPFSFDMESDNCGPALPPLQSILDDCRFETTTGHDHDILNIIFCGDAADKTELLQELTGYALHELHLVEKRPFGLALYLTPDGHLLCLARQHSKKPRFRPALLKKSAYAEARSAAIVSTQLAQKYQKAGLHLQFHRCSGRQTLGFLVGLQIGAFHHTLKTSIKNSKPRYCILPLDVKEKAEQAKIIGNAVNLARVLIDLPSNTLTPSSYSLLLQRLFAAYPEVTVDVLDKERLKQESMNLLVAVGAGSCHAPCLVHLRYRKNSGSSTKPFVFIGKGVTFDAGGLDMKPATSMRQMKKDMAGSATVTALAYYWIEQGKQTSFDIYLPLAENVVSATAYHPGDVITSRSGITVEISNTDAEGRLMLADALSYALRNKEVPPAFIIMVATLTSAAKIALGSELASLMSNNDHLAQKIEQAAWLWGDPVWRLPLYEGYQPFLNSSLADLQNSSNTMFGGAITAGLFLKRFAGRTPWALLDIMGYTDAPSSDPLGARKTNGQTVQNLIGMIHHIP